MSDRRLRVLFVCTGNSARSQMAEALLQRMGDGRFEAFSAGTDPRGVHPLTVRVLEGVGIDSSALRSKSVEEYLGQEFDFVVTVCDRARESCPVFPGGGEALHWGFDDPAAATGTEEERLAVFERVLGEIRTRLSSFVPVAMRSPERAATTIPGR